MQIRNSLYEVYWAMRRVIAPPLKYSQYLYTDTLKSHLIPKAAWLDLGCGHQILPRWQAAEERELVKDCKLLVGIDYDLHSLQNHQHLDLRVRGDIARLPFADDCFDLVTANMVVEHLGSPEAQFREVNRVLKPGGIFIFHTPSAHGYLTILNRLVPEGLKAKLILMLDGRKEEDVFETYYRANTDKRIRELSPQAGFEIVKVKMLVTDAVFAVIPPLALPELLWIRLLMTKPFRSLRTNIIAILKKPATRVMQDVPSPLRAGNEQRATFADELGKTVAA